MRDKILRKLRCITDNMTSEKVEKIPDWIWGVYDFLIDVLAKILCVFFKHEPVRDQCNRSEHDFCLWCYKSLPNSYKRIVD